MGVAEIQHAIVEAIGRQKALDPPSHGLQHALESTFDRGGALGKLVENALHGTWMGHALHPVLTDIPVGAWTVAQILDLLEGWSGKDEYGPGADMALLIGFLGALGAAATGLTDWKDTNGDERRIGLVHGVFNIGATALYGGSLLARSRGDRGQGRVLAAAGYSAALLGAMLGGDLVYRLGIGVSHAPTPDDLQLEDFAPIYASDDLDEGEVARGEAHGVAVALIRQHGRVYALADRCSHLGGPLSDGKLGDGCIECPWHGSQFALEDGKVLQGPATIPQPAFQTRERNGMIEVRST